jgi:hypothetical protein
MAVKITTKPGYPINRHLKTKTQTKPYYPVFVIAKETWSMLEVDAPTGIHAMDHKHGGQY